MNSHLDAMDMAHLTVMNLTNGSERWAEIDGKGDGLIQPSEFDSSLTDERSGVCPRSITTFLLLLLVV